MRAVTRYVSTPVLVGVALALPACSSTPDQAATAPVALVESSLIPGAYANPLDPIMFPDENQQGAIDAAGEAMVAECMAERGFDYRPGAVFPKRRGAADAQYTFSVTDPEVAAVYGFHPASWVESAQHASSGPATTPEGYDAALYGDPGRVEVTDEDGTVIATYDPDSCSGQAKDAVTPGWARQERLFVIAADILYRIAEQVTESPDVTAAFGDWSDCMSEAGYDYPNPMAANNDERFGTDLPTAEEIPVAVASATCQQSSGALRTWSRVRAEYTQAELEKQPGIVTEWLELQQQAADTASGS